MFRQQLGCAEAAFLRQVVGDDRAARAQRESGRELKVRTHGGMTDNAFRPADTRANQQARFILALN